MAFNWENYEEVPSVTTQPTPQAAAPVQPQAFDWNAHPEAPAPQIQIGPGEATLRGVENGMSLGFGSRANAGLGALYDKLMGSSDNMGQDYDKILKREQESNKIAQASHPWLYGAGSVAGFAVPTALSGGANLAEQGIVGGLKAGAGYGAIQGVSDSQDLSDPETVIGNAAKGAAMGGVTGGVLSGLGSVVSPITEQAGNLAKGVFGAVTQTGPFKGVINAASEGLAGRNLWGEEPQQAALQGVSDAVDNAKKVIQGHLSDAAQAQSGALNSDSNVDISPWVQDVYRAAINGKKATSFDANRNGIDQVLNVVDEFVNGNPESNIQGRGMLVTPSQARELKQTIGALGTEGDTPLKNTVGLQFANRIVSSLNRAPNQVEKSFALPDDFQGLKDVVNDAVQGLPEADQRIHQLLSAMDEAPNLSTLANSGKVSTTGQNATNKLDSFLGQLPDDVRQQIEPELRQAAKTASVAAKINASGFNSPTSLASSAQGALLGTANWAGAAANSVGNAAKGVIQSQSQNVAQSGLGKSFDWLYNQSPETFTQIGAELANQGGTLGEIGKAIAGSAAKDGYGRNAVIYALQQNPGYRNAMEKHITGEGIPDGAPASATGQNVNNWR